MRESWTDERLDYLKRRVDDGFEQVDQRFEQVDQRFEQVDKRFEQVDKRFDQVDERFRQVDQRFDRIETDLRTLARESTAEFRATQRLIIQVGGGAIVTFAVGFLTLLGMQL